MSFFKLLESVRPEIELSLLQTIAQAQKVNEARFPLDNWFFDAASARVTRGKLMRGGLLMGAYQGFGGSERTVAVQAGAAVELYGTGLLMQDDVTDRSQTRRGLPTLHLAAQELATSQALSDPEHFGINSAIYVADILYFLAHDLLDQLAIDPKKVLSINRICERELWLLGLAQLEELRVSQLSVLDNTLTDSQILKIYAGKTGRYSISWPLQVGALLADASAELITVLATIGEQIGVLFQLRDDELGVFGNPAIMGKSVDDDIREGKKTLYWLQLRQQLPATDTRWRAFGNQAATSEQVDQIRQFLRSAGIEESVHQQMQSTQADVQNQIAASQLPDAVKALLGELLVFVVERKK